MTAEREETTDMDNAAAAEYLALRYHCRKGRLSAKVYGKKQAALFLFTKAELDRFLREVVPHLKVRGNPRKGGARQTATESAS